MAKKPSKTTQPTTTTAPKPPPPPFTAAPPRLLPLLSTLDPSKVYITHLDAHPAPFKRKLFAVPVLLNLIIAALLVWRAYAIAPSYLALLAYALGAPSPAVVDTASKTWSQLAVITLRRVFMLALDFVLVKVVLPWPLSFFAGAPGNPVLWRWAVGFRDVEIVVRESRGWGAEDLIGGLKEGQESAFFRTRILPAVEKRYVEGKTGYLMMNKDWDLDFAAMVTATRLVGERKLEWGDLKKTVWACGERGAWMGWRVYELDEGQGEADEERVKKFMAIKDKLTAMGKEDLFYRWVELMQYVSSQPGEFTVEKQIDAVERAKKLFADNGVDMEGFLESTGGDVGLPGFEPQVR